MIPSTLNSWFLEAIIEITKFIIRCAFCSFFEVIKIVYRRLIIISVIMEFFRLVNAIRVSMVISVPMCISVMRQGVFSSGMTSM